MSDEDLLPRLKLLTPPAVEVVTGDEAKTWAGGTHDVALYTARAITARRLVEAYVGGRLITQRWQLQLDAFPCDGTIELPYPPWQTGGAAAPAVDYYDSAGALQTLAAATYQFDSIGGRLAPVPGESWPSTEAGRLNAVLVSFTSGFGALSSDVPGLAKDAILAIVADWMATRTLRFEIPPGILRLLDTFWGELQ